MLAAERAAHQGCPSSTPRRLAGLPAIKTLDEFDVEFAPGVPTTTLQELASLDFIERNENVVLIGPFRVGKSHLAITVLTETES